MKALQKKLSRLEARAGADEYLGRSDDEGNIVEQRVEDEAARRARKAEWEARCFRAADILRATMATEHADFVWHQSFGGLAEGQEPANLAIQFWLAVGLIAINDTDPDPYFRCELPPILAQVYLDHPDATPIDYCSCCRSYVPVLLNKNLSPYSVGDHSRRFFARCPLCSSGTGYCKWPYYFWQEIRRVQTLRYGADADVWPLNADHLPRR